MSTNEIVAVSIEAFTALISLFIWAFLAVQRKRETLDKDIQAIVLFGIFLLGADAFTYLYKLFPFDVAYYIARFSNCLLFTLNYCMMLILGKYLCDYLRPTIKYLKLYDFVKFLTIISLFILLVSQFTNLLYYFDELNIYHRTKLYPLAQVTGAASIVIYAYILWNNKDKMARNEFLAACLYMTLPTICTVIQTFFYGFPFQALSLIVTGWILFLSREIDVRNRLEQALSSKDEFLSKMSHDLRTPLNGILGIIEIDNNYSDDVKLLRDNRAKAKVAAEHLLSLLNDVLELSKLDNNKVVLAHEAFDMRELLKDVITISKMKADDYKITMVLDYDELNLNNYYVYGSPLHIKRVLINIIDNSIKYNKEDGKVVFSVAEDLKEDKVVYKFVIKDTGIGMSKKYIEHIFEPFSQERNDKDVSKGTGLGMSIVKNLIELMNSSIKIESIEKEGSTFIVNIPFEIAKQVEEKEECALTKDISGKHILLVEDNDLNREIAKTLLSDKGAIISEAIDGIEALKMFEKSPLYAYDLILMDVMMPNMNGVEATRRIRSLTRIDSNVAIIGLSANAFAEDIKKVKDAGMNDYVSKPFKIDELVRVIGKYC